MERSKIVFVLTEGKLDVPRSPDYGRVPERRTDNAHRELRQTYLPRAVRDKVQMRLLRFLKEAEEPQK